MSELLKLISVDAEDIQVVSAIMQDAIIPVADIAYFPDKQSFVMIAQRLKREGSSDNDKPCERIRCALNLTGIISVRMTGFNRLETGRILDLLAIIPAEKELSFMFAGDAALRLALGDWRMIVEDFGEPWPSLCQPCHEEEATTDPKVSDRA